MSLDLIFRLISDFRPPSLSVCQKLVRHTAKITERKALMMRSSSNEGTSAKRPVSSLLIIRARFSSASSGCRRAANSSTSLAAMTPWRMRVCSMRSWGNGRVACFRYLAMARSSMLLRQVMPAESTKALKRSFSTRPAHTSANSAGSSLPKASQPSACAWTGTLGLREKWFRPTALFAVCRG